MFESIKRTKALYDEYDEDFNFDTFETKRIAGKALRHLDKANIALESNDFDKYTENIKIFREKGEEIEKSLGDIDITKTIGR